jgi:hypothetical protein
MACGCWCGLNEGYKNCKVKMGIPYSVDGGPSGDEVFRIDPKISP